MQKTYDPLFKLDSKGKTRVWFMEQDGDKYRTFDGIEGGKVKPSGWKTAKPTNVGRSNERDGVAQATFEIEACYTKQLKGAYYRDVSDIALGCRFIEPMLADKYKDGEVGEAQPKMDGFRCLLRRDGGWSREGEEIPGARHLVRELTEKGIFERFPHLTLDGELYNHEYKHRFGDLASLLKKQNPTAEQLALIERDVQLHAYDLIVVTPYPHKMLKPQPRAERCRQLAAMLRLIDSPMFHLVESVPVTSRAEYDEAHGRWLADGFEGSMFRVNDGSYDIGRRSSVLQKRKDFDDEEFEIVEIQEGEGNWAGAAKRVVCWLPGADRTTEPNETNTFEAGLRGTYDENVKLLSERDKHRIVTIRFFGYTTTAIPKPRFGVATKFHGAARTL